MINSLINIMNSEGGSYKTALLFVIALTLTAFPLVTLWLLPVGIFGVAFTYCLGYASGMIYFSKMLQFQIRQAELELLNEGDIQ